MRILRLFAFKLWGFHIFTISLYLFQTLADPLFHTPCVYVCVCVLAHNIILYYLYDYYHGSVRFIIHSLGSIITFHSVFFL